MNARTARRLSADDVCRAAVERLGVEDASVTTMRDRVFDGRGPCEEWFVLSVQRGGEWEVLGRRRTKTELLEMVKLERNGTESNKKSR